MDDLTPEQERIAQRAAKLAIEQVYTEIGRNVVKKALLVVGFAALALLVWLGKTGRL